MMPRSRCETSYPVVPPRTGTALGPVPLQLQTVCTEYVYSANAKVPALICCRRTVSQQPAIGQTDGGRAAEKKTAEPHIILLRTLATTSPRSKHGAPFLRSLRLPYLLRVRLSIPADEEFGT